MSEMVQVYWLPLSTEKAEEAEAGFPIFIDEESDEVVGFIAEVGFSGKSPAIKICLWAPVEISTLVDEIEVVDSEISEDDITDMLLDALDENPHLRELWENAEVGDPVVAYSGELH
jgi:hypothetical protein